MSDPAGLTVSVDDLREGDLELHGRVMPASNATFVGVLGDLRVIYKPQAGERPLWDFPDGTLAAREVAAYAVSELLGWELVPRTVMRDGPLGIGALSQFHDHDPEQHYFELLNGREDVFRRFAAFDAVINNTDRKGGHVLLDEHGHVWGIDHGTCFHVHPKLRTVIWEFAGETLPDAIATDLGCLLDRVAGGGALQLTSLLAPIE